MEKIIKAKRVHIDALIINVSEFTLTREIATAKTNLQRAQMFLGKMLGSIGEKTPYTESNNSDNEIIEEPVDKAPGAIKYPDGVDTTIKKIKFIREEIEIVVQQINATIGMYDKVIDEYDILSASFLVTVMTALTEAEMWLGQELNNIKLNTHG
jgi:hypothetical protein